MLFVLVLLLVIVIEHIESTTIRQHKESIEKREKLFDATCVMFRVDYDYDYEHEHEHEQDGRDGMSTTQARAGRIGVSMRLPWLDGFRRQTASMLYMTT